MVTISELTEAIDKELINVRRHGRSTLLKNSYLTHDFVDRHFFSSRVDLNAGEEFKRILRRVLREYLDENTDRIGNGLGGALEFSIAQYANKVLCATTISGSEETAKKIIGWAKGGPMQYYTEALVVGGELENQVIHDDHYGISIEQLPEEPERLLHILPIPLWAKREYVRLQNFSGHLRLRVKCAMKPVFLKAPVPVLSEDRGRREITWGRRWPLTGNPIDAVCQALIITKGVLVSKSYQWDDRQWRNYEANTVFVDGFSYPGQYMSSGGGPPKWTRKDIEAAMKFHEYRQRNKDKTPELERAIEYFLRMLQAGKIEDKAIEMRMALETLFLARMSGEKVELGYRTALYAAHELGETVAERQKILDTVKKAYGQGSRAIHGTLLSKNKPQKKETAEKVLLEGQEIIRRGIIKRAKEGKTPDWDNLVLGGNKYS